MAYKWKTIEAGIRTREHATRKHGVKFDTYFTLRFYVNGKRTEEALGWASQGWTLTKARAELARLKEAQRTGQGEVTLAEKRVKAQQEREVAAQEETLTLQGIFEGGYMAAQQSKTAAALKAEHQLMKNHIAPFFGSTPIKSVTPTHMDKFLAHLKVKKKSNGTPLAPRTVQYIFAVMRQVWNYALSRGLIDMPYPAKRVKVPTADNRRTRFLTREEAERVLEALEPRSQDIHDMALLSLFCGLRAGELFKLTWADVNFQEGFVHVRDRKNKESGTAWMTPRVRAMLERRFACQSDFGQASAVHVFPNKQGSQKAFTSKLFSNVVAELGLNDGITDHRDKIVFHSLRHTFASWLAQKGVPLHSLAGLMGHKNTTMTQRYAHLAPDVQRAHAMLIDDAPTKGNVLPFKKTENTSSRTATELDRASWEKIASSKLRQFLHR